MRFSALLAIGVLILGLMSGVSQAGPIYADALVSQQFVTSFGSGLVTGAPDAGGLFLGDTLDPPDHPGNIVVKFSGGLSTGPGADLFVVDYLHFVNETANIFVSPDNIAYTFVGTLSAVANSLDIDALYSGDFSYVRVANASTLVSIDIDAVGGNFAGTPTGRDVPEPACLTMFGCGIALWFGCQRRRQSIGAGFANR